MIHPFTEITGKYDCPVYVIGGGSSLQGFDFSRLDGLGVKIGINKVAWYANCDVMVTLDQHFAKQYRHDIAKFVEDGGEAVLAMPPNDHTHPTIPGATYVRRQKNPGLSDHPNSLFGMNSGIAGLGLAYMRRPPSIALLGFDMQYASNGKTHWHEGYSWHNPKNHKFMEKSVDKFDRMARQCDDAGIEVVNYVGNPKSKITAFPIASLDDL